MNDIQPKPPPVFYPSHTEAFGLNPTLSTGQTAVPPQAATQAPVQTPSIQPVASQVPPNHDFFHKIFTRRMIVVLSFLLAVVAVITAVLFIAVGYVGNDLVVDDQRVIDSVRIYKLRVNKPARLFVLYLDNASPKEFASSGVIQPDSYDDIVIRHNTPTGEVRNGDTIVVEVYDSDSGEGYDIVSKTAPIMTDVFGHPLRRKIKVLTPGLQKINP